MSALQQLYGTPTSQVCVHSYNSVEGRTAGTREADSRGKQLYAISINLEVQVVPGLRPFCHSHGYISVSANLVYTDQPIEVDLHDSC